MIEFRLKLMRSTYPVCQTLRGLSPTALISFCLGWPLHANTISAKGQQNPAGSSGVLQHHSTSIQSYEQSTCLCRQCLASMQHVSADVGLGLRPISDLTRDGSRLRHMLSNFNFTRLNTSS